MYEVIRYTAKRPTFDLKGISETSRLVTVAWKITCKWTNIKVQMEKEEHFRATDEWLVESLINVWTDES